MSLQLFNKTTFSSLRQAGQMAVKLISGKRQRHGLPENKSQLGTLVRIQMPPVHEPEEK